MQILTEIVSSYAVDRKIPVLFARVPQSKTVRTLFKSSGVDDLVTKPSLERYFGSIDEALRYIDQRGLNYQPQRPDPKIECNPFFILKLTIRIMKIIIIYDP